ncbi:DUF3392 domain-containing protein [Marinomonas mediterranea]|jgi:Protein of unknown function (DUF3392).|uniref:DUF3392 domain-containing protein n=1 Tax=Marinomonas mediterranea (strain ATCC 700492 / JCM 21426 / NBRC 103028 / MMB-1) TaxID=717774 RepID=F2K0F1_MARM1|nr:DUF3392 domain-containing protein [Marinomonas mediterranea]ADZ89866.1 hypothetical protein Marme_0572 [Marinomonas mediterranea MMB-1]WCN07951.1 DUF3392 family protein [Marinomonas mediterranea]WCN12046.1 DUF3392 family protein [Marinomonas mediterranea]WCN16084.1 DUF3392 family protein [Marinomonas mediterranea MMB-1]
MDVLFELNSSLARFMQPHLNNIALAFVATCLVIYGDKINRALKKAVSSWMFVARVTAFILMCTFGYGLLTIWVQPFVFWSLTHIDVTYRPLIIIASFVILGVLAERKRYL